MLKIEFEIYLWKRLFSIFQFWVGLFCFNNLLAYGKEKFKTHYLQKEGQLSRTFCHAITAFCFYSYERNTAPYTEPFPHVQHCTQPPHCHRHQSNRLKGFSMQKSNELGKEIKLNSCLIAFNPVRFGKAVIMSCNFSFLRHLLGWWGGLMDFSTVKHSSLSIKV